MTDREPVVVACLQVPLAGDRAAMLDRILDEVAAVADEGADVVVLPVLSFESYLAQVPPDPELFDRAEPVPGPTVERLQRAADDIGVILVANLFEAGPLGQHFLTSPVIASDGTLVGATRMMHVGGGPDSHGKYYFTPSTTSLACYRFELGTLGVVICYDRHYPETIRQLALQGAEIVCAPAANLADEPLDMYVAELRTAAFQNHVYVAMANRVGPDGRLTFGGRSLLVGPDGSVLAEAPGDDGAAILAACDPARIRAERLARPYFRDRRPEWYAALSEPTMEDRHDHEDNGHDHAH